MATMAGITYFVADLNGYALASLIKHNRLAEYDTRKIVLVGGSNLTFGIDSQMIQRATGCPVVNMGMNGYLGVRFMLEEIKTKLKPTDVVVLAFEWDNYFKSVDGTALDLLAIVRVNPIAFTYLSLKQKLRVTAAIPRVAQEKALRLTKESIFFALKAVTGISRDWKSDKDRLVDEVQSLSGFTPEGDLISHLGLTWPNPSKMGHVQPGAPIESQMIYLIRDFATQMSERDITVMMSYTPILRSFYNLNRATFEDAHQLIKETALLAAPAPPSSYAYDEGLFFDTVYHLNAEGRSMRTQKLIHDIQTQFNGQIHCPQTTVASSGE